MGLESHWLPGTANDTSRIRGGDLVIAADVWSEHLGPAVPGARYVLHNFNAEHPVFHGLDDLDLVRLQVYTSSARGERLGPLRYWTAENRVLTQPWGSDLFAEEFYDPVFNAHSRDAAFVGAIWNTDNQGNTGTVRELEDALAANGLRFQHKTQVSEDEMIATIRGARIAPAFAGPWQVEHNYLPCRVFKNVAYGQVAVTNVPRFYDLFADCSLQGESIQELIREALTLKRGEWAEMVLAQQRVVARFTYRESLQTIERAFES